MKKPGPEELRQVLSHSRSAFISIGIFSFFYNLLVFTGPLFMMQVYDRVLASGSEQTLIALVVLMIFLYIIQGILDNVRGRMAARIGARFQASFDMRVFRIVLERTMLGSMGVNTNSGMRDLDSIQRALSSPAIFSIFDIPWAPVFIFVIFTFDPWMGWLALAGAAVMLALTWANQRGTRGDQEKALNAARMSEEMTAVMQKESDTVKALGLRRFASARWLSLREAALDANIHYSDSNGFYATASKTFRIFLQSAILALGAWLVLEHKITSGSMIAASIIVGRALAPIDTIIGQWALMQRAWAGWKSLGELLAKVPFEETRTALPKPKALIQVESVTAAPPGERLATLKAISFEIRPGQALGVIGQSGSGKTTLARIMTGIWPMASGKVRLDGAALDQYGPDALAEHVGYLPQDVALFEGTIAENIARLQSNPDAEKVIAAAKKAAAHEMILSFPKGYDTKLPATGQRLSGGQKQRIGLARALYGDPALLVLDEPNSNLDAVGSNALNLAIRNLKAEGRSVVIMAHRPAAIEECDLLLILENGARVAFGPRDEVLKANLRNAPQLIANNVTAGAPAAAPAAPALKTS
jgi:ATP-binding cassette, subfamily C, bacterial